MVLGEDRDQSHSYRGVYASWMWVMQVVHQATAVHIAHTWSQLSAMLRAKQQQLQAIGHPNPCKLPVSVL